MPATIDDDRSLPPLIRAMLTPDFYPHPVAAVELKQTHTSYVLLAGEFAYKVRKSVRFAFIDCSTVARRLVLCQRELALNRRLSPDVYLGVVAIQHSNARIILDENAESAADAIEFAVKMRRLPEDTRLDLMIARAAASTEDIAEIANTIESFHARAPQTHSWRYGGAANIWRMTIENLIEIEQLGPGDLLLNRIAGIEVYSRRFIANHWELLNSRAREGRVREGHGDLRTDAIYLTSDGIRIIDCLEFDERLRYGDIANETAFLAMDIDRLRRPDLSRALNAHFAADPDVPLLTRFYKSYRATVRAKVELLRSRQPDCSAADRQTALANAGQLLDLALVYSSGPRALLIVCGASGTGKSTLAAALGGHLGFEILSSDITRKRLAGIAADTPAAALYNQGIYAPEFTARVYDSICSEANRSLNSGKGVILDATFGKRDQRQLIIEIAQEVGVEPLFIECRADKNTTLRRLSERDQDSNRVSDASPDIYLQQLRDFEPLSELSPGSLRVVDTTGEIAPSVREIERKVYLAEYSGLQ